MKVFTLFFLCSVSLHAIGIFTISTESKNKALKTHRVILMGTNSDKNSPKVAESQSRGTINETHLDGSEKEEGGDTYSDEVSEQPSSNQPVKPVYPKLSRLKGEEGENLVRFKIDSFGKAFEISLMSSSGYERLDQAAIKAIQEAEFHDTNKLDHLYELRFKFTLNP